MYKIGQVVWLISEVSKQIEPVKVDSRTTVENENGAVTHHHAETTDGNLVNIEKQGWPVFESLKEAESHLMSLAAKMVSSLAENAAKKARAAFQTSSARDEEEDTANFETSIDLSDKIQTVELPDDTKARLIDLSDTLQVVELPDGTKARLHLPRN